MHKQILNIHLGYWAHPFVSSAQHLGRHNVSEVNLTEANQPCCIADFPALPAKRNCIEWIFHQRSQWEMNGELIHRVNIEMRCFNHMWPHICSSIVIKLWRMVWRLTCVAPLHGKTTTDLCNCWELCWPVSPNRRGAPFESSETAAHSTAQIPTSIDRFVQYLFSVCNSRIPVIESNLPQPRSITYNM